MNLYLKRDVLADKFTLGSLLVDGKHFGFTCEDTDRKMENGGEKVYGQTAIPRGTYPLVITFSHRFQKDMPELLGVKGFEGIRIHGGNNSTQSLGCILLGVNRTQDGCSNCKSINDRLISLLEAAEDAGEKSWITVE